MKKMKKIIALSLILGAFNFQIKGQEVVTTSVTDFRQKFNFGLKLGANYSDVYGVANTTFTGKPKYGMVGGVFIVLPLGKLYGVQGELLYSQKGFKGNFDLGGKNYEFTRTTNHLDVPLMFAIKPSEFVTVLGGPIWSYLIDQKDSYSSGATTIGQETEFSNSNLRKNTLGFNAGIDFTMKHLVAGLRVGWDLQKNDGDGTTSTMTYKNNWFQATIGYRIY